jgi:hypothetical protein
LAKLPGGPVVKVAAAERDLREELKASSTDYRSFWYEPCLTPDEVYSTACRLYHSYSSATSFESQTHPAAPARARAKCPVCGR